MLCCNLFIECDFILDFVLLSKIKLLRVVRYSGAVAVCTSYVITAFSP